MRQSLVLSLLAQTIRQWSLFKVFGEKYRGKGEVFFFFFVVKTAPPGWFFVVFQADIFRQKISWFGAVNRHFFGVGVAAGLIFNIDGVLPFGEGTCVGIEIQ